MPKASVRFDHERAPVGFYPRARIEVSDWKGFVSKTISPPVEYVVASKAEADAIIRQLHGWLNEQGLEDVEISEAE